MADNELQQTLDHLLNELRSGDSERCRTAMVTLGGLNASSPAILRELERTAIHGTDEDLRAKARELLGTSIQRLVRKNINKLSINDRQVVLHEIETWEAEGLIEPERAEVIRGRYNFDAAPATPDNPVVEKPHPVEPSVPQPITPAEPRPSLMQTLLSESSIRIYLYLGAFFVIASALILAAVVEAARLPILAAATLGFGAVALVIRKRLPQPSFALFIVFSFLLPIDANVLEETIGIQEPALSTFWTVVFLLMALIWGLSIWFYASRFFSLVAFVAMGLAFYRAAQIFQTEPELWILFGVLAAAVGLIGTRLLQRWKDDRFALPLFLLAQVQVAGLLLVSLTLAIIHIFDSGLTSGWWLVVALTWIAAGSFFAASDILFRFFAFPWMAVAALLPLPWFILNAGSMDQPWPSVGFWVWGAVLALASEGAFRLERVKRYGWSLLAGSVPLFLTALFFALDWANSTLVFAILSLTALVYTGLHLLRPRWYVWSTALLGALLAYFVFFTFPAMQRLDIPFVYQLLGASILLTVPELFMGNPFTIGHPTRFPTLMFGMIVSAICIGAAFIETGHPGRSAIVFLTFAILFTLHTFHFNRSWIGYFGTTAEILAILYALDYFNRDLWLPALTLMSVLYYGTGFFLRRTDSELKAWAPTLINSGLVLGALLSLAGVILEKETAGWYMIIVALLFAVEIFAHPLAWLEIAVEMLLSLALFRILADFNPPHALEHVLFGTSLIWLGGDLVFSRFIEKRIHRPLTLGVGYLALAASVFFLFDSFNNYIPVGYYLIYAAFFAVYALSQKEPRLGYFLTAFVGLAVVELVDILNVEKWTVPLIVLAVLYFAAGFLLRQMQKAKGWDTTLLYSGLALGVLTSIGAPFQGGLDASIPIAIAATLFAVEAFVRRSAWWALPANMLYLISYFVILAELHVEEPQFYSIGAALLGMLMHYLLTRANSRAGAFIMGMLSQVVLLGTTYIQMVSANELKFFFLLFAQSLIVLIYGLVQRSRSLVITPIVFAVLGVVTVVYSALKGLSSVILIGCTGIVLLLAGIAAVLLRERITKLGEQLSDWRP